jgi:hypothetical protein
VFGADLRKDTEVNPLRFAVRFLGAAAFCALVATSLPNVVARASAGVTASAAGTTASDAKVLDLTGDLDPTCKACDDFYQFATGGWTKTHPIPPGHASWGALAELADQNRAVLTSILETAAKDTSAPAGSDTQKLGAFYRACMDEAGIEKAGTTPIAPFLTEIDAVSSVPALVTTIGKLHAVGVNGGLNFGASADTKDSSKQIASIGLGGTGLPDREYYLRDTERFAAIRKAYQSYVATQLVNLGEPQTAADTDAAAIVALETAIAKGTPPRRTIRRPSRSSDRSRRTSRGRPTSPRSTRRSSAPSTSPCPRTSRRTTASSRRRRSRRGRPTCATRSRTRTLPHCRSASPMQRSRFAARRSPA